MQILDLSMLVAYGRVTAGILSFIETNDLTGRRRDTEMVRLGQVGSRLERYHAVAAGACLNASHNKSVCFSSFSSTSPTCRTSANTNTPPSPFSVCFLRPSRHDVSSRFSSLLPSPTHIHCSFQHHSAPKPQQAYGVNPISPLYGRPRLPRHRQMGAALY